LFTPHGTNDGAKTTCHVALCDGTHGPDLPGTIHSTTVREVADAVFTVTRIRQDDGALTGPQVLVFGPDKTRVDAFRPKAAAAAGAIFIRSADENVHAAGLAFTVAAALAERITTAASH